MSSIAVDIAVLGAGPSGLALAARLAQRGARVAVVSPEGGVWPNTYGVWSDEVDGGPLAGCVAARWSDTEVVVEPGAPLALGRGYLLLDNTAAVALLRGEVKQGGGALLNASATGLEHDERGSDVVLDDGSSLRASVVVDATGVGAFTAREGAAPRLFQVAVGLDVAGRFPLSADRMRLMDFTSEGVAPPAAPPSFLYAMPRAGGAFVEETTLIGDGSVGVQELEARLRARMRRDGFVVDHVVGREEVRIPMDVGLPRRDQRVLAFGAAASLVHPATGYQVGRSLKAAPRVADALADGLAAGHGPDRVVADAYKALWPDDAVAAHRLLQMGGRFLSTLDTRRTQRFFDAFFSLPRSSWVAYLTGDLPVSELAAVMLSVFGACGGGLRLRMMWSAAELRTLSALTSLTRTHRSA